MIAQLEPIPWKPGSGEKAESHDRAGDRDLPEELPATPEPARSAVLELQVIIDVPDHPVARGDRHGGENERVGGIGP